MDTNEEWKARREGVHENGWENATMDDIAREESGPVYCRESLRYGGPSSLKIIARDDRHEDSHPFPEFKGNVG